MFDRQELGSFAQKLGAFASEVRWIAWLVAGFWIGRFLVTQDPIELVSAIVTFALVHLGGLLLKAISGMTNDASAHDAGAAEPEEEVVSTQE